MKNILVLAFLASLLAVSVNAGNNYLWGEVGAKDYLLEKTVVSKLATVGLSVSKKYVFKQKDLNPFTITAVKVTDRKKKNGATCVISSGGPGSKGVTLKFKSQRGSGIKDEVEIWGR